MSRPARQVRTVRLHAPSEQLIRRGALLLEDALHTASLPDAASGRLLVVRSLACGTIRAGQSSASLALRIEQGMRQLSATAIYAEETTAETALAVYFHDAVEPYVRLALRLARHEPTRAWFWPLAVRGWSQTLPRDEALRLIVADVSATEAGTAAVALLLRTLHEHGALPGLLAALRWQDGPALLRAGGWTHIAAPFAGFGDALADDQAAYAEPEIGTGWRALLNEWRGWWGTDDARTVWLAHIALIAERPTRLLDARLSQHARRVIRQLIAPSPAATHENAPATQPHASSHTQPDHNHSAATPAEISPTRRDLTTAPAAPGLTIGTAADQLPIAPPLAQPDPAPLAPDEAALRWAGLPQRSAYAGLFFALPVMARLGVAGLLEQQPQLIELSLPDLVLRALAEHLGCPAIDPALLALAERSPLTPTVRLSWIAPPSWRATLATPGPLLLRSAGAARRVLFDHSGRLPLALWHGSAPNEVRALMAGATLDCGPALPALPDLDLLVRAWLVALRRWCRRYARLGLFELVYRPGSIAATRTHLDILFDHQQADIRVRRSGLDIDPGWLPWLGRVVMFHYLYGEL